MATAWSVCFVFFCWVSIERKNFWRRAGLTRPCDTFEHYPSWQKRDWGRLGLCSESGPSKQADDSFPAEDCTFVNDGVTADILLTVLMMRLFVEAVTGRTCGKQPLPLLPDILLFVTLALLPLSPLTINMYYSEYELLFKNSILQQRLLVQQVFGFMNSQ